MSLPLWEQLAELPVPPAPPDLGRRVHQRLNLVLLGSQLLELAFVAWPLAVLETLPALVELLSLTLGTERRRPP